jgi:hypothetical protein
MTLNLEGYQREIEELVVLEMIMRRDRMRRY